MTLIRRFLLLLLPLLLAAACSSDDEPLAAYVEGLGELRTDAAGYAESFTPDGGTALTLTHNIEGLSCDSTYRILALYLPAGNQVSISSYSRLLTLDVATFKDDAIITDPLTVTAFWRSGAYFNLRLALKAQINKTHYFGVHLLGITENADGSRRLNLQLIHDRNGDEEYYTRETYISFRARPLAEWLTAGRDSVRLTANTYGATFERTIAY